MTRILITGGAGFIGSSLADLLLEVEDYSVVVVDNLSTGEVAKLPVHPRCRFVKCDVNNYNDISSLMMTYRFDYVFHYAAVVGVKRTIENPVTVLNDLNGIRHILDLCKNTGVKRVFFSSSSEVYGESVELPQHEQTTPLNSRLPYAVVKNAGEAFCRSYQKEYGLNYTILRFFNTYGPKQSTDFVVSRFLEAAIANQPITIYGEGSQSRTFCYIRDNVECTLRILKDDLHIDDVINIGNDSEVSILQLAKTIIDLTGSRSRIEFLPPLKEGDMNRRLPDLSRMKSVLKRNPISLEEGLKRILESQSAFLAGKALFFCIFCLSLPTLISNL